MTALYDGNITWTARSKHDRTTSTVTRVIWREKEPGGGELAIDVPTPHGRYTINLRVHALLNGITPAHAAEGRWSTPTPPRSGGCSARVFASGTSLFLFGEWEEAGELYDWWIDLWPVEEE